MFKYVKSLLREKLYFIFFYIRTPLAVAWGGGGGGAGSIVLPTWICWRFTFHHLPLTPPSGRRDQIMLIKSFFRYFSLYWSLDIHITHSSQAKRGDRCHAARPLSSWRYVRPLQWLWVNWLVRLATGALASWRGLVRTRLGGPSHSSVIGKSRAVTDGETLTPHYPRVKCKHMNQANLWW